MGIIVICMMFMKNVKKNGNVKLTIYTRCCCKCDIYYSTSARHGKVCPKCRVQNGRNTDKRKGL